MLKSSWVKSSVGKKKPGNIIDFTFVALVRREKDLVTDVLLSYEDARNLMDRCHCYSSKQSCLILSLYDVVAAWEEANCTSLIRK